jgi:hypothetical protein
MRIMALRCPKWETRKRGNGENAEECSMISVSMLRGLLTKTASANRFVRRQGMVRTLIRSLPF